MLCDVQICGIWTRIHHVQGQMSDKVCIQGKGCILIEAVSFLLEMKIYSLLSKSPISPSKIQISIHNKKMVPFQIILDNFKNETCSNDHLYKMIFCLRQVMLSLSKPILINLLLYNTTTCLMQLMATLLCPKLKKSLSKTATAKLSSGEIGSNV